jgi:hypothetical protein
MQVFECPQTHWLSLAQHAPPAGAEQDLAFPAVEEFGAEQIHASPRFIQGKASQ